MKEFVIWDTLNEKKGLFHLDTLKEHEFGLVLDNEQDRFYCFEDIGLRDIDNNPIYANCSVVEFEFHIWEGSYEITDTALFGLLKKKKYLSDYKKKWSSFGVFRYDDENCAYGIYLFSENIFLVYSQFRSNEIIKNIKVIDTVQENKLGLIK